MLGRYRPVGQLVFVVGASALIYLFATAAVEGQRREKTEAVLALRPAYEGNDRRAPDFSLPDRHGKKVKLSSLRGKVVVLNFWTITCGPCIEEMPSLDELITIVANDPDIAVLTVSVDEDWDAVRRIFPRGTRLPILFDPDRKIVTDKYGTRLFPETWIIDRKGIIRARFDGARDWSQSVAVSYLRSLR
ncbi:MAG: TlpA family protein disulfide reductase [Deltaproteobacteria bacterium]|nr:TlpA family protein disulfide reductase [Deltaproteobacteria bacterium]